MCTAFTLQADRFYFGRNMDMEGSFGERVVVVPRHYPFTLRQAPAMNAHYAMIGMATVVDGYPLFADAMNEKGLCVAALNFPQYAHYFSEPSSEKSSLAPFEWIPWLLGRCANAEEAKVLASSAQLVQIPFRDDVSLTPLHWLVAASDGIFAVESTREGLQILENPVGVLTNSPPLPFHLWHLHSYENLFPKNPTGSALYSLGMGAVGLPGDYSSPSRFVKTAYLKRCVGTEGSMADVFRILGAVAPVRGSVLTSEGASHYTTYSCCMDPSDGTYYYTTYQNPTVTAVNLHRQNINGNCLFEFPLLLSPAAFHKN